jgi:hypothetical protein
MKNKSYNIDFNQNKHQFLFWGFHMQPSASHHHHGHHHGHQDHDNEHDTEDHNGDDVEVKTGLNGFLASDAFQRIVMTAMVVLSIYAAIMASLLSIFVPQLCCPIVSCLYCDVSHLLASLS